LAGGIAGGTLAPAGQAIALIYFSVTFAKPWPALI